VAPRHPSARGMVAGRPRPGAPLQPRPARAYLKRTATIAPERLEAWSADQPAGTAAAGPKRRPASPAKNGTTSSRNNLAVMIALSDGRRPPALGRFRPRRPPRPWRTVLKPPGPPGPVGRHPPAAQRNRGRTPERTGERQPLPDLSGPSTPLVLPSVPRRWPAGQLRTARARPPPPARRSPADRSTGWSRKRSPNTLKHAGAGRPGAVRPALVSPRRSCGLGPSKTTVAGAKAPPGRTNRRGGGAGRNAPAGCRRSAATCRPGPGSPAGWAGFPRCLRLDQEIPA